MAAALNSWPLWVRKTTPCPGGYTREADWFHQWTFANMPRIALHHWSSWKKCKRLKDAKKCYSGQKKHQTIKNTVISHKSGRNILFVGKSQPGRSQEKKMANEDIPVFPAGSRLWPDTGYRGYLPAGVVIIINLARSWKTKKVVQKISLLIERSRPSGFRGRCYWSSQA